MADNGKPFRGKQIKQIKTNKQKTLQCSTTGTASIANALHVLGETGKDECLGWIVHMRNSMQKMKNILD